MPPRQPRFAGAGPHCGCRPRHQKRGLGLVEDARGIERSQQLQEPVVEQRSALGQGEPRACRPRHGPPAPPRPWSPLTSSSAQALTARPAAVSIVAPPRRSSRPGACVSALEAARQARARSGERLDRLAAASRDGRGRYRGGRAASRRRDRAPDVLEDGIHILEEPGAIERLEAKSDEVLVGWALPQAGSRWTASSRRQSWWHGRRARRQLEAGQQPLQRFQVEPAPQLRAASPTYPVPDRRELAALHAAAALAAVAGGGSLAGTVGRSRGSGGDGVAPSSARAAVSLTLALGLEGVPTFLSDGWVKLRAADSQGQQGQPRRDR